MSQTLADFSLSFGPTAQKAIGEMGKALVNAHRKEAFKVAKRIATAAKDTGELAASVTDRPNVGKVTADAPHANIIDRGRKRGYTPRGSKRVRFRRKEKKKTNKKAPMLGSKKAPKGISRPTAKEVVAKSGELSRAALAEFEREMTKP